MNYTPIPFDFLEEMEELSDAEYGRLVRWGQHYHLTGEKTKLSGNERFYAKRMQLQIDRYVCNYNEQIEQRRKAGLASAEKRREATEVNDRQQEATEVNEINQTKTKTKTKTKTNTETDNREYVGRKSPFVPPTVGEVRLFCEQRGNGIDPEAFVMYYQTRGWKLSRGQSMKDWRAAVISWEKHEKEREQRRPQKKTGVGAFVSMMEEWDREGRDVTKL